MTPPGEESSPKLCPLEWTDENVTRFWHWQSRFPETYFTYQFGRRIADHLRRHLAGSRTVLDYGCGPGFLIPHLARLDKEVTASDFSSDSVRAANAAFAAMDRFRGAVTMDNLLTEGTRFDAAVSIEVIEHLNDSHLESFFGNLKQLVRPGGRVIITTPNEEDLDLSMVYCPESDRVFHRWQHVRNWSATSLSTTVTAHGLSVEQTYTTDFSKPRFGDLTGKAKRFAKRALGRVEKRPHLVCVAEIPG